MLYSSCDILCENNLKNSEINSACINKNSLKIVI